MLLRNLLTLCSFKIQVIFRPHLEFVAHVFVNDKNQMEHLVGVAGIGF